VFTVGDAIRTLRRARHWTAETLATRAGLSAMTISKIERGTSNYRRVTLERIATALNTTVESLTPARTHGRQTTDPDDGDSLTAQLLSRWQSILPEHRPAALEALTHVAVMSAEFARLRAEVRARERQADDDDARIRSLQAEVDRRHLTVATVPTRRRKRQRTVSSDDQRNDE